MKTEFERISEIMYTLLEHQPVIDVPYEKINDIAIALVKEGYGDVSEYKAEIERLKAENCELTKKLEARLTCDFVKTAQKHAQIGVLNKLKDSYGLYYLSAFGVKERMLADILNPIIEELKK